MLKALIGFVVVVLLSSAGGYYYLHHAPVVGLKTRGTPPTAETPTPPPVDLPPAPFIAVTMSEEKIDTFPETVIVHDGDQSYTTRYTGQMRREKAFDLLPLKMKTYDIASYTVEPTSGEPLELLDGLLVDGPVKVYMIKFINALPGRQIVNDIYKEINTTFTDVDVDRLKPSIDAFCQQFAPGSKKNDLVFLVWLPEGRIYSCFNTAEKLYFIGQDIPFPRAIWRIWAGEQSGPGRVKLVSRFAEPAIN